jgi:hypothetical protein
MKSTCLQAADLLLDIFCGTYADEDSHCATSGVRRATCEHVSVCTGFPLVAMGPRVLSLLYDHSMLPYFLPCKPSRDAQLESYPWPGARHWQI